MELEIIKERILTIRGQRIILDKDIAELYGVETKNLKRAVRRNIERFPADFMFELSKTELENWRYQFGTSNSGDKMGLRYAPFAFTEQGVAMLSSVLKSKKSVEVNIMIMRAFVMLRQHLSDYEDLKAKISKLEKEMNLKFQNINQALNYLIEKDKKVADQKSRSKIGYKK